MNQQVIDEKNKELSEYSASKERVLIISDDTGNIIEEVIYSLDEILEAEEDLESYIDSDYFDDLNNEDLESYIHSNNDSFQCDLNHEELERIEKEYLKIIGEFEEIHIKNLDSEETEQILQDSKTTEIIVNAETQSETPEEIEKNLLKKFKELKTGDEIRVFIIKNIEIFEGFFNQYNIFFRTLKNKFEKLSIITLQSLVYDLKRRGKDFEELVIQLEIIINERLIMILNGSSLDQEDDGIVITNGFSEIITNRDSKFIIIENTETGEYYIVAKGYDELDNKITFELHRDIFQYFLDKIGFSLKSKFDAYDYEVRGGGYIQINEDGTMYLHKESMDYGEADFEITRKIILEKFGINASYYKK